MKIIPVAADSLGVRSLAFYLQTKDSKIFIDPSAALGPSRYGLPPAPQEFAALEHYKKQINKLAKKCKILVISHYHYDHHDPHEDFYTKKIVLAKDRINNINKSQRERGKYFEDCIKQKCKLIYCDNQEFEFGATRIKFSEPFYHGPEKSRLGFVLMTMVDDGFRLLHASDVQGPVSVRARDWIIKQNPDLLIIDGPPTIFLGWKFSYKNLDQSIENLLKIIKQVDCEIILDHHLLRDLRYKELLSKVYEKGDIKTAAEYLGKKNQLLEAHRKELWRAKE